MQLFHLNMMSVFSNFSTLQIFSNPMTSRREVSCMLIFKPTKYFYAIMAVAFSISETTFIANKKKNLQEEVILNRQGGTLKFYSY